MIESSQIAVHSLMSYILVIGVFCALIILLLSVTFKVKVLKQFALLMIMVFGICTVYTVETGRSSKSIGVNLVDIHQDLLDKHQQISEKASLLMYLLSLMAVLSYAANKYYWKRLYALNFVTLIKGIFVLIWLLIASYYGFENTHVE